MNQDELEKISHLYYETGNLRLALKEQGLSDSQIYKKSKELKKNAEFQAILERDARNYIDSNLPGVLIVLNNIINNEDTNEKTRLTAIQAFLDRSKLHKTEKTEIEVINSPTQIISEIYANIKARKITAIEQPIESIEESNDLFLVNKGQNDSDSPGE